MWIGFTLVIAVGGRSEGCHERYLGKRGWCEIFHGESLWESLPGYVGGADVLLACNFRNRSVRVAHRKVEEAVRNRYGSD